MHITKNVYISYASAIGVHQEVKFTRINKTSGRKNTHFSRAIKANITITNTSTNGNRKVQGKEAMNLSH